MQRIRFAAAVAVIITVGTVQAEDLLTIYRQAVESSPLVAQVQAQLLAERFGKEIAASALSLQINVEGAISRNNLHLSGFGPAPIDTEHTPSSYSVTLTKPLNNCAARFTVKAADSMVQRAEATVLAVQQDLILQAANAYFAVLLAEAQERTALSRLTLLQKISDQAESEYRAGSGDLIAVDEARARLDSAQADHLRALNGVQLARRALERLTHQPVNTLVDLNTLEPQGPVPDQMDEWVKSALENQPILEQGRREIEARQHLVAVAAHCDDVVFALNAQYSHADGAFAPGINRRESLIGLTAVWPLFQGGRTRAEQARAQAQLQVSKFGLEALTDSVRLDTQRAFLNLVNSVAQFSAAQRALDSANIALSATQKGYEVGSRSAVEVLDSAQRQADAEASYTTALYDQLLARLQLKASAGVLSETDVVAINQLLSSGSESGSEQ